jgi:hypothetical protein
MAKMDDEVGEVAIDGEAEADAGEAEGSLSGRARAVGGAMRGISQMLAQDTEEEVMRLYDNLLFALKARGFHEDKISLRHDREQIARCFLRLIELLEEDVSATFDFNDLEYRDGRSFVEHLAVASGDDPS